MHFSKYYGGFRNQVPPLYPFAANLLGKELLVKILSNEIRKDRSSA